MDKKGEDIKTPEKINWTYEEWRAWLKNTRIEKVFQKIITLIFGRRWLVSFEDKINIKENLKDIDPVSVKKNSL